uniref:Uncharacterized protein n=1 Tax=Panagrolaimus davidi TaxID=227884 RepID=A0A914QS30_9BILA
MFEIPRQQKDEAKEPEIMQFKSSQKLIDPNQEYLSKGESKEKESAFEKLKEVANNLFKEAKYSEAIKAYAEILELSDLSSENQATIYSNRSASYLLAGNSLNNAKIDAEKAIKLWPSWWKGYYRLARVYVVQEQWIKAETNLKKALALNSGSKEIRDELSFVRSQFLNLSLREKNNPAFAPLRPEEDAKKVCNQLGISEKQFYDLQKNAKNFPKFDYILKGHQYRDGFVVPQDFKKAAEFYEKAANLGNPEGMFNLGLLYKEGKGVKRDYGESMKWFLKAANSKTLIMTEYEQKKPNEIEDIMPKKGEEVP